MLNFKKGGFLVCFFVSVLLIQSSGNALFLQTADTTSSAAGTTTTSPTTNFPVQAYRLKYAQVKSIADSFTGILGAGEGISVNEKLNTIVIRASERNLARIGKMLEKMDSAPLQVQVEAKIIELKTGSGDSNQASTLGVSLKYTKSANNFIQNLTDVSSTAVTSILGLYGQLTVGDTQMYINALEKATSYDLVASPWITALNHEKAEILIGSKYGYSTFFTSTTGTTQNIAFLEVGTKLSFTPHINDDGFIVMDINPSVSDGQIVNTLPQENTTETKNKVLVKDGQSIVIGGLSKNYVNEVETGVPILSAIPFIGNLFKRTSLLSEKRELMVVITPHIVTPTWLAEMSKQSKDLDKRRQDWHDVKGKLIH